MTDSTDATTLHWAVMRKNKNEILHVLSKVRQEDLKIPDLHGNTILHMVLTNENLAKTEVIELLEIFLDHGFDIYTENKQEKTILHRAIQLRMKSVVDFLVSRKVDINRRNYEGNSIAHDFIEDESKWFYESLERRKSRFQRMDSVVVGGESVKFLVKAYECDREAQENESARFAEYLIEKGFNFDLQNDQGTSALHLAIKRNLHHILHVLVRHTRDIHFVDYRKKSLLQMFIESKAACRDSRKKHIEDWYPKYASRYAANIVTILLDRGVSTWPHDSDEECTSLQTAIECEEDTNIIKILIDHGLKSLEKCSATEMFAKLFKIYLWWGVSKSEYFRSGLYGLISQGADVNDKDESGITPLYHAFHRKNVCAVHYLIDCRADFSAITNFEENLFHALARVGFSDKPANIVALEVLFDLVASRECCDVNARNSANETPLHWAARCGNLAIARKLIECGAEVDCKDANGCTPLHHAVFYSKSESLTKVLLKNGANANSKDHWGRRLLSIGVDVAADKIVPLLLKWGAYVNDVAELPFWKVILRDDFDIAKVMLAYGADINNNDFIVRSLFDSPCSDWSSWQVSKYLQRKQFLLKHWAKLKVANLPCSKEYKAHVKTNDCQEAFRDCSKEIEKLKCTYIDSCTSIYRFLHMDFGRRRSRMSRSEKLRQLVQSSELEEQFPNYSVVISASYHETFIWKSLLEPAKLAWFKITDIRLPDECLESIFAHLRNADLMNMIGFIEDM